MVTATQFIKDLIDQGIIAKDATTGIPAAEDVSLVQRALKGERGRLFLDGLPTSAVDYEAFLKSGDTAKSLDHILGDALTNLYLDAGSVDKIAGVDVSTHATALDEYRAAEVNLLRRQSGHIDALHNHRAERALLNDAIERFGSIDKSLREGAVDKWVEGYTEEAARLATDAAHDPSKAAEAARAKKIADRAERIGADIVKEPPRLVNGTWREAENFERVLAGLERDSKDLTETIKGMEDSARLLDRVDGWIKGMSQKLRDLKGVLPGVVSKRMPASELDSERIVESIREEAAKVGGDSSRFMGKFTGRKPLNEIGKAAEAGGKDLGMAGEKAAAEGFKIMGFKGSTVALGAAAALGIAWAAGLFSSNQQRA